MEYYYLTGDKNISELCRKWASWAMENTYLHSDGSYEIPCTLEWSGQPDTWTGKPSSNKNLHCTIKDWTVDAGVTAALAKALIYYAAATEKHEKALNEKARETSKQLLDRMWIDYKDDLGISSPESRDDFKRFFDEVYVPVDFSGTNAQGAEIKNGTTFIEMRPKYKSDPGFSAIEQAVNSGTAPLMKYHRYWVQAEIAMANAMYHIYFEHTGNGTVPGIKQEVNKGDSPTPDNTPVVTPIETSDPTPTVTSTQTPEPTNTPTIMPTGTNNSTHTPTIKPTPTHKATNTPTKRPTYTPTKKPTNTPTKKPTNTPTKKPTNTPTKRPTYTPTKRPTNTPTKRPTYTPTKRPTNTPTKKPATPSNKVLLQYYNNNANEMTSNINVSIKLTNNSDSSIRLSDVKIRYYYTIDGEKPQNFACDWSTVGSSNVTGRFAKLPSSSSSADYYLEIGFTDGAGSLESNTSIDIQTRFWKSDWSNYILNNDYSTSSGKIALYVSGKLVSGSEP
ncbi:MAG TPA: glycoside hydrolase family 48 protein, partial [Acetivibrio sp.]|nr:glycoside hydrolase family 48 protein [Acetivibrio sp.]